MKLDKYQKRLLKLYKHLKRPQAELYHDGFSFDYFCAYVDCGTIGCAAGELPGLFKSYWKFGFSNSLEYKMKNFTNEELSLQDFFNLSFKEVLHLFYPNRQSRFIDPYYEEKEGLSYYATKDEVVANMERFLKIKGILK